jgi:hypothetical protein
MWYLYWGFFTTCLCWILFVVVPFGWIAISASAHYVNNGNLKTWKISNFLVNAYDKFKDGYGDNIYVPIAVVGPVVFGAVYPVTYVVALWFGVIWCLRYLKLKEKQNGN